MTGLGFGWMLGVYLQTKPEKNTGIGFYGVLVSKRPHLQSPKTMVA